MVKPLEEKLRLKIDKERDDFYHNIEESFWQDAYKYLGIECLSDDIKNYIREVATEKAHSYYETDYCRVSLFQCKLHEIEQAVPDFKEFAKHIINDIDNVKYVIDNFYDPRDI